MKVESSANIDEQCRSRAASAPVAQGRALGVLNDGEEKAEACAIAFAPPALGGKVLLKSESDLFEPFRTRCTYLPRFSGHQFRSLLHCLKCGCHERVSLGLVFGLQKLPVSGCSLLQLADDRTTEKENDDEGSELWFLGEYIMAEPTYHASQYGRYRAGCRSV